jgi:hypothetical protein
MSIIDASVEGPRRVSTAALAREVRVECSRALPLLDKVISERDDVLLDYARRSIRGAARLSAEIARAGSEG